MSYTTVINAIDTILKTATGVDSNTVYKYDRYAADELSYINSFKDSNSKIHGYMITRRSVEAVPEASRVNHVMTVWIIRGFYGLASSGATENSTFQPLLDVIAGKFKDDPRLGNTVLTSSPLQIDRVENLMFGDVLVHFAEMRLVTEEEESFT